MKKLLIYFFVLFSLPCFAQPLNLDDIEKQAKSKTYEKLLTRYNNNDTTLTLQDYRLLFYGQVFQQNYSAYSNHDSIDALTGLLIKDKESIDYKKVLSYTALILNEYPFNIEQVFITAIVHEKLGNKNNTKCWFYKYNALIETLLSSGDGKSPETAIVVTKIKDEYAILSALGLKFQQQTLIHENGKQYDKMNVAENDYGIETLYFDISLFFGKW